MVNSRQKGSLGETKLVSFLKEHTGLNFMRTPGSGSGKIKGDLYFIGCSFCIEVKNYKEDPFNSNILCNKTSLIPIWWEKLVEQSGSKKPLLFYRWNRSKWFVITQDKPNFSNKYIDIPFLGCYIAEAEEWIKLEEIKWSLSKS